jgi:hypothetical protein
MRYLIIILSVASILAACTPAPPSPAQKQAAQEQAKKTDKNYIKLKETGW